MEILPISFSVATELQTALVRWFRTNHRTLPWRPEALTKTRDAYATWISETMLQQTRVAAVITSYQAWMQRFPTVAALASSHESEVLQYWKGLGYYSRARNLLLAARIVMERHKGIFPADREQLLALPGIGAYTAGAIVSLAYRLRAPILDGNLRRVFARLYALPQPASSTLWWNIADAWADFRDTGLINEALMELGALVCTPRLPKCTDCPLSEQCQAYSIDSTDRFPVSHKVTNKVDLALHISAIIHNGFLLLVKPRKGHLLSGHWTLPMSLKPPQPGAGTSPLQGKEFRHAITRHRIVATPWKINTARKWIPESMEIGLGGSDALSGAPQTLWIPIQDVEQWIANSLATKAFEHFIQYNQENPHRKRKRSGSPSG